MRKRGGGENRETEVSLAVLCKGREKGTAAFLINK